MSIIISRLYEFGSFHLDPPQRLLLCDGKTVPVTPKAFELLVVLVERRGSLVEKSELLGIVWPDVSVEEGNLAVMISQLRKALGDDRGKHEYIETVSKYGYRFVAPVRETAGAQLEAPPAAAEAILEVAKIQPDLPVPPRFLDRPRLLAFARPAVGVVLSAVILSTLLFLGRDVFLKSRGQEVLADASSIHSLAVLPFHDIGSKNEDGFLGEGTADALITRLGNFDRIVVRPTSAIEKYDGTKLTPAEVGKEQGVDAVLDGRVQRDGDRVRLTVQLIRVRDGAELWADAFDEKFTNIFALEDEVSARVMQSLQVRLTSADVQKMTMRPTESTQAYEAYIRGRFFWNKRTKEGMQRGLDYFREAIRIDPGFAEAYEGVADSYVALGVYAEISPNDAFPAARKAAEKALQMNDRLADAHATLGVIHFYYDWDGPAAEDEFRRAIDINPNYAMAHSWSGEALAAMGRFPEAVEEAKRALNDDPLSQIVNSNAGWTFCLAGQTETAIETLNKAIEMDPSFPRTHFRLGLVYESKGLHEQAIAELQKAAQLSGGNSYYEASLAYAYAVSGKTGEARHMLSALSTRSAHGYVPAYAIALVYTGMNDKDNAFSWFEKTSHDHSTSMAFARVDPSLGELRADPRFADLARRLNF